MFIKVTQSGQRRYAQLVESFRNEDGKPRQRTVCTLGRLEDGGEIDTLITSLQRARGIAPRSSTVRRVSTLISLTFGLKRAPTTGSSAGFDLAV